MTNQKRLRQIARAIRGAVADALFTLSDWFFSAGYRVRPHEPETPIRVLHDLTVCEMLDDLCLIDAERRENTDDVEYAQALDIQERHIHAALSQLADKA